MIKMFKPYRVFLHSNVTIILSLAYYDYYKSQSY